MDMIQPRPRADTASPFPPFKGDAVTFRLRHVALGLVVLLGLADSAQAQRAILIVRHGEKVDDSHDPDLTDAGRARAASLARVLRDIRATTIYQQRFSADTKDGAASGRLTRLEREHHRAGSGQRRPQASHPSCSRYHRARRPLGHHSGHPSWPRLPPGDHDCRRGFRQSLCGDAASRRPTHRAPVALLTMAHIE